MARDAGSDAGIGDACGPHALLVQAQQAAGKADGGAGIVRVAIGADLVAKARPDGYTLLLGHSNSNAVAPALYPKLPYDVLRDFTPVVRIATTPLLLTVNAAVPAKDVQSFIALSKSKQGGLSFASSGNGSAQHLAAARFMLATQTRMTHVPYKGSGQAIVDLLAALRYKLEVRRSPELGDLPLVTLSAPFATIRPADHLVTVASGLAGGTTFAEVLDLQSVRTLKDPLREEVEKILRSHGQEL